MGFCMSLHLTHIIWGSFRFLFLMYFYWLMEFNNILLTKEL